MSERGDSTSGSEPLSTPMTAPRADVDASRAPDRSEPVAPESGPYLRPNDDLEPETYAVGQVLAGKYRVERLIGEGAMGLVLAATHLGLDEVVAIKFMRAEVQRLPGTLSRFAKEAKIAARIRSEHVIKVLDVGVSEPIGPYIVMEYLEGRSLADIIDTEGPLPVQRAAEYLLQVCEGLAAAHALGVTHRDIKPENLFVTGQPPLEVVKVLDFGISKATLTGRVFGDDLALDKSSYVMGTPLYMSPEQIRATPHLDSRTDIWAMGAVLYELVSGNTAFSADSMTEICAKILETPAPRLADPCPPELAKVQEIIEKCLEKEPQRRFQSIADLALALLPLASERARAYADRSSNLLGATRPSTSPAAPASPPPESPQPPVERPRRRSRFVPIALALAALGLAAALAVRWAPQGPVLVSVPQTLTPAPSAGSAEPAGPSSGDLAAEQTDVSPSTHQQPPAAPATGGAARSRLAPTALVKAAARRSAAEKAPERAAPRPSAPAVAASGEPSETSSSPVHGSASSPIRLVEAHSRMRLVEPPPLLPPSSATATSKQGDAHAAP